jgi:hypothetical protein
MRLSSLDRPSAAGLADISVDYIEENPAGTTPENLETTYFD